MKRFINKEISVKCNTEEELTEFLELCEKEGLRWLSEDKPTEWMPRCLPLVMVYNLWKKRLTYTELTYVDDPKLINGKIVEFQDFIKDQNKEVEPIKEESEEQDKSYKLKDFLKRFEGLDPELEIESMILNIDYKKNFDGSDGILAVYGKKKNIRELQFEILLEINKKED